MVLRPGGTFDRSPAIYCRSRKHKAHVPAGRPITAAHAQAEGQKTLNRNLWAMKSLVRDFDFELGHLAFGTKRRPA